MRNRETKPKTPQELLPGTMPETMRVPVIAGAALIAFVFSIAGLSRLTDVGTLRIEPAEAVKSRTLLFSEQADGTVVVTDKAQPSYKRIFNSQSDGFVRVAVSSLNRDRSLVGLAHDAPFRLMRDVNDRLWLEDTETHARILADAFGPPNARSFDKLLNDGRNTP